MASRRRFFSGTSESQAAIEAAAALGVPVDELAYRTVDKRGALRPGRVVIEVDPENPRRPAEALAAATASAPAGVVAPSLQRAAGPAAGGERGRLEGRRPAGDGRERRGRREEEGEVVLEVVGPEAAAPRGGEAGAAEAARLLADLAGLELATSARREADAVAVELAGPGRPALVARHGELLRSFEYLLRRMVRDLPEGGLVADSGGWRAEREETLRRRAAAAAEEVRRSGEPLTLEPLTAAERRIVHLAIQEEAGVASASEGHGELKRIRIFPA